ncbi:MAG: DUF882 domain-containing protein [Gammaproteobacteria bacterium]|jgi:uncharacterized protein YcbK (DUF882 family)|nr:DUF882 domain-containing protein [Gammaproteobacteria bacterium]
MTWINHKYGRRAIKSLLGAMIVILLLPAKPIMAVDERQLSFYHTHTGKELQVTYQRNGEFLDSALSAINNFLYDFRTGDATSIDPELVDLIYEVREAAGGRGTVEVISAYRSPETNEMLRSRSSGVAKNSQHLFGKAIDIRLRDVELTKVRDAALAMKRGGVGYYETSNFVHIDTGRVRRW